jgi:hypothetical protein
MEMYSQMRDEYRKFFPPLKELPYVDVEGEQRLAWAKEESLEEMNEPPATDAEEAEDASSPFSKDDYMKMAETGSGTDPAGVVSERSTEQSRMKKLEELEASFTDQQRALWKILKCQAETSDKSQRGINITAAAAELDISRQMAYRHLRNIRDKAQRFRANLRDLTLCLERKRVGSDTSNHERNRCSRPTARRCSSFTSRFAVSRSWAARNVPNVAIIVFAALASSFLWWRSRFKICRRCRSRIRRWASVCHVCGSEQQC